MTVLETLLDNPEHALALLDLEVPALPADPEGFGANNFHNGPFSNWDNWTRFGNN